MLLLLWIWRVQQKLDHSVIKILITTMKCTGFKKETGPNSINVLRKIMHNKAYMFHLWIWLIHNSMGTIYTYEVASTSFCITFATDSPANCKLQKDANLWWQTHLIILLENLLPWMDFDMTTSAEYYNTVPG